ncbi:ABC transporter substrate-binding protein [Rhizobium leguminosarum]|uniref:ABC transporter substrate-binding protein n=1 Tax=Rhizobium leguminosarum TaxID=384 RepID=UPI001FED496D|nr:ABC transporter substrate-binding protein [Rhizobium leguminosarum]
MVGGLLLAAAFAGAMATGPVMAEDKITIGVAMPFQGNGWQKGFLAAAQWAAAELNAKGKKVELSVVDAAGDPQTQIQQINNLTLRGSTSSFSNPCRIRR